MSYKIIEKDKELTSEKKKQIEELIANGDEAAVDLKYLISIFGIIYILTTLSNSCIEINALEKYGYCVNLNVSNLNNRRRMMNVDPKQQSLVDEGRMDLRRV